MSKVSRSVSPDSSITVLRGIGPARAAAFGRLGIGTLRDLIFHFPRGYENRGDIHLLSERTDGTKSSFLLTVATQPKEALIRKNMTLLKFRAFDESGTIEVVFFNQSYLKNVFSVGDSYRFFGSISHSKNTYQLISPAYEKAEHPETLPAFVPLYPLTEGLTRRAMTDAIGEALSLVLPILADPLPPDLLGKYGFPTLGDALRGIHAPQSEEQLNRALRRLVYDELLCFALGLGSARDKTRDRRGIPFADTDQTPFFRSLPYALTSAQQRACAEIAQDLRAPCPMRRILIGDVGSGKTVCAAAAIFSAFRSQMQSALLVPTEILARQHYADLSRLFAPFGLRIRLLLGATKKKEKSEILAEAEAGTVDLIVGTHALLGDSLRFARLGLIVTDEQHRFGVMQRAALQSKCDGAHLLVMSATPIPRTLALALYGDLEVSTLDELPPGRQRVDTFVVDEQYRQRLNRFIRKNVAEGGQVYIVCPAVESTEEEDETPPEEVFYPGDSEHRAFPAVRRPMKGAVAYATHLGQEVFPDLCVAFLHGKMKPTEKDELMRRFAAGEIDILVSTTVIEVGVNVPNACLMIVENAECFGLSQLHQLRGRVGRGQRKSYCILISDSKSETALRRLQTMRSTYDGYKIAEIDLEMRGPGEFFSTASDGTIRQSGGLSLRLGGMCDDTAQLRDAFTDARAILDADPLLGAPEHRLLGEEVRRMFSISDNTLS